MLTKDQILQARPKLKEVDVPEWGGTVFIRPITLQEQAKLADLGTKYDKALVVERMKHCTLRLLQWAVCDDAGNSLFEETDLQALMGKSASAFLRLQDEILAFSGLTEESRKELQKNLPSAQDSEAAS
jgi:hypothetical protein